MSSSPNKGLITSSPRPVVLTIFALRADTAYRMMRVAGRTGMRIGMRPGRGTAIGTGFGDRSGTGLGPQRAAVSPDQIGGDRAEVGVYPRMRTGHAGDLFLQEFAARFAVSKRVEKRTEGHSPDIT